MIGGPCKWRNLTSSQSTRWWECWKKWIKHSALWRSLYHGSSQELWTFIMNTVTFSPFNSTSHTKDYFVSVKRQMCNANVTRPAVAFQRFLPVLCVNSFGMMHKVHHKDLKGGYKLINERPEKGGHGTWRLDSWWWVVFASRWGLLPCPHFSDRSQITLRFIDVTQFMDEALQNNPTIQNA